VKLTKAQQEVIDLMRQGWELGVSTTADGRWWLQKGGLGRGGETNNVNANTAHALLRAGLIRSAGYSFPTQHYLLTDKGRGE
jgi:hypothetical protein